MTPSYVILISRHYPGEVMGLGEGIIASDTETGS